MDEDAAIKIDVRTVWISDLHLGTPGCQAQALLDFLRDTRCETIYLVGDIIDEALQRRPACRHLLRPRYFQCAPVWDGRDESLSRSA